MTANTFRRYSDEERPPLGRRLVALRRAAGMSMSDTRDRTGISTANLSQIESGHSGKPELWTLVRLAQAYGADVNELARLAGYPQPVELRAVEHDFSWLPLLEIAAYERREREALLDFLGYLQWRRKARERREESYESWERRMDAEMEAECAATNP